MKCYSCLLRYHCDEQTEWTCRNNDYCKYQRDDSMSEHERNNKIRVVELINEIGKSLDSPDYASKVLTECGKEILEIVDSLERKANKLTAIKVVKNEEYNNYRCPYCNNSKGEKRVLEILNKLNIDCIPQYRFKDCKFKNTLPFDFYLPKYNICIEFDGEQHYKIKECFGGLDEFINIKIRDTIKNEYCKNNNIKLIRIPYWEFDGIENIITNIKYE